MSEDLEAKRAMHEAKRAANRAAYPGLTAIMDLWRAEFGNGVILEGGQDFITDKGIGWTSPASPCCDVCTGHTGGLGCDRMDFISIGDDQPKPDKVFCGYRLVDSPTIYYDKKGRR